MNYLYMGQKSAKIAQDVSVETEEINQRT